MTINSRPQRDDQQDRSAFVERATEEDTTKRNSSESRGNEQLTAGGERI